MNRVLFWTTITIAVLLSALVFLTPLVNTGVSSPNFWLRVASLFAHDAMLRQTSIAGAIGLVVTACLFFRNRSPRKTRPAKPSSGRQPRPGAPMGA